MLTSMSHTRFRVDTRQYGAKQYHYQGLSQRGCLSYIFCTISLYQWRCHLCVTNYRSAFSSFWLF